MRTYRTLTLDTATAAALTLAVAPAALADDGVDDTRPVVTLTSPGTALFPAGTVMTISATDDVGLARVVGNIYRDGELLQSSQSPADGATAAVHEVPTAGLTDGAYSMKYNAQDLSGNIAHTKVFAFTVDSTGPTVTVKPESDGSDGYYKSISFKLFDSNRVDGLTLNGVAKDLTDNTWSDLNGVRPGVFGAVEGVNTLVVHDVAGNSTTVTFTLDTTAPELHAPEPVAISGPHTFRIEQTEANPDWTYVEVNQIGSEGKWVKLLGQRFEGTNTADFTVDPQGLLVEGVRTQIKVTSVDRVGHRVSTTVPVVVDFTAPTATIDGGLSPDEGHLAVSGTATDSLSGIRGVVVHLRAVNNGGKLGAFLDEQTVTVDANGNWSADFVLDGYKSSRFGITVRGTDVAGNDIAGSGVHRLQTGSTAKG